MRPPQRKIPSNLSLSEYKTHFDIHLKSLKTFGTSLFLYNQNKLFRPPLKLAFHRWSWNSPEFANVYFNEQEFILVRQIDWRYSTVEIPPCFLINILTIFISNDNFIRSATNDFFRDPESGYRMYNREDTRRLLIIRTVQSSV